MGLFIKVAPVDFRSASRDKREMSVVKELGHDVLVIAKNESRTNEISMVEGWNIHYRTTRPLGQDRFLRFNRIISILTWAVYVRKMRADYISGHNLDGLLIAWLSTRLQLFRKRPVLIYDAHEFEAGLITSKKPFTRWKKVMLERFLMRRSDVSIFVNDTIGEEIQKLHRLSEKPCVVRNVPKYWEVESDVCKQKRKELFSLLNIPEKNDVLLGMYHGGIMRNRGIESLIKAISKVKNSALVIMGRGLESYIRELEQLTINEGIEQRVLFFPAVTVDKLWQYVGAADFGVSILMNTCLNHYYALPNKLFENIQSETPVIGSNFPEISHIINKYEIGVTCNPHNVNDIIEAIEKLKDDKVQYAKFESNLKIAKKELCWENEKKVLTKIFKEILV